MADPAFPRWGSANFARKQHGNEENLARGERSKILLCRSATEMCSNVLVEIYSCLETVGYMRTTLGKDAEGFAEDFVRSYQSSLVPLADD